MVRRRFSGPVRSSKGFEVGHGDESILVIDKEGNVHTSQTGHFEGTFEGDLEGNVVGNLEGNVQGDVTGNLTGDVTGNLTGDVDGNLYGVAEGALVGNLYPYIEEVNHNELPDVPEGFVGIFYTPDEGLVLKLPDDSILKIDVTPIGGGV